MGEMENPLNIQPQKVFSKFLNKLLNLKEIKPTQYTRF